MIETVTSFPIVRVRHRSAPLLKEREQYLSHLMQRGLGRQRLRCDAAYLIHIVRIMNLNSMRLVSQMEIEAAGHSWATYQGPFRKKTALVGSPKVFIQVAQAWLRFHGQLESPPPHRFQGMLAEFIDAMRCGRGLAEATIRALKSKVFIFLKWLGERHESLAQVSLHDVDEFLASRREEGWTIATIASQCQALRTFFRYAELRHWCPPCLAFGIRSPRIPKYDGRPKAPTWAEVRKLIESASGSSWSDLRAKPILLLFAIYGLRSSEVSGLQLSDFDWHNETFTVRRAKRGGIQQYPIQFEVGEAIIQYLRHARKRCPSRQVFLAKYAARGPIGSAPMWQIVAKRMRKLGIQLEHVGPHSLRHACATRLLQKGASLQEIADFLGHHSMKSVGIYAHFDVRLLRKVARFRLVGVR